jgi:hypothetical protein
MQMCKYADVQLNLIKQINNYWLKINSISLIMLLITIQAFS